MTNTEVSGCSERVTSCGIAGSADKKLIKAFYLILAPEEVPVNVLLINQPAGGR